MQDKLSGLRIEIFERLEQMWPLVEKCEATRTMFHAFKMGLFALDKYALPAPKLSVLEGVEEMEIEA